MKDLFLLVADIDMEKALDTLIKRRTQSLGIKNISFDIKRHPEHDSGIYNYGVEFIRTFQKDYQKFILLFDYDGCGSASSPEQIRTELLQEAAACGFQSNSVEVIVINPELELWAWKSKYHIGQMIGWKTSQINSWLQNNNIPIVKGKPKRPKEAYEGLLHRALVANSSSNFAKLASKIGLKNCNDLAFQLLIETLRRWFQP